MTPPPHKFFVAFALIKLPSAGRNRRFFKPCDNIAPFVPSAAAVLNLDKVMAQITIHPFASEALKLIGVERR
jgi:hypothetical protein